MKNAKLTTARISCVLLGAALTGLGWASAGAQSAKAALPVSALQSQRQLPKAAPTPAPAPNDGSKAVAQAVRSGHSEGVFSKAAAKPPLTEIKRTPVVGGIVGQARSGPNPLQLLNPFAPPEYDGGEVNLVPDDFSRNHRSLGLAFLRISF